MFYAYSGFEKPEPYASITVTAIDWAVAVERQVFLENGQNEGHLSPEKRSLTATELGLMKERIDESWQRKSFGGCICGAALSDLTAAVRDSKPIRTITPQI